MGNLLLLDLSPFLYFPSILIFKKDSGTTGRAKGKKTHMVCLIIAFLQKNKNKHGNTKLSDVMVCLVLLSGDGL